MMFFGSSVARMKDEPRRVPHSQPLAFPRDIQLAKICLPKALRDGSAKLLCTAVASVDSGQLQLCFRMHGSCI